MINQPKGHIFIVAAPSGGGKTSLVKALVQEMSEIEISVSHTTRDRRAGESEGVHYFFVAPSTFQKMVEDHAFIESATVFGHQYGTSHAQIHERLAAGVDVVLDIDWQGALQIKQFFPDAVSIFIVPPSLETLLARLQARQRDNEKTIEARMQSAQDDIAHYTSFDYLIVNDHFNQALSDLKAIVQVSRLQLAYQRQKQEKLLSLLLSKT